MRLVTLFFALLALAALPSRAAEPGFIAAPFDAAHWELDGGDIGFATYLGEPALRIHQGAHAAPTSAPAASRPSAVSLRHRGRDGGDWGTSVRTRTAAGTRTSTCRSAAPRPGRSIPAPGSTAPRPTSSAPGTGSASSSTRRAPTSHRREVAAHPGAEVVVDARLSRRRQRGRGGQHDRPGLLRQLPLPLRPNARPIRRRRRDCSGLIRRWHATKTRRLETASPTSPVPRRGGGPLAPSPFASRSDPKKRKRWCWGWAIARIYVNGALLYRGDNSQYSRDPGFLGIVGLHETLAVPLRPGRNDIAFVVEENSGGWGAEAQFADPAGLTSAAFDATP